MKIKRIGGIMCTSRGLGKPTSACSLPAVPAKPPASTGFYHTSVRPLQSRQLSICRSGAMELAAPMPQGEPVETNAATGSHNSGGLRSI